MRIVLDARWIFPEISGIGAYTRELIRGLGNVDRNNHYVLLFNDPAVRERTLAETGVDSLPNFAGHTIAYGVFSPAGQFRLPLLLKKLRAQVYHSTNYMIPLLAFPRNRLGRLRCVATIHDVIPMLYPHHAPRSRKSRVYPLYRRLMVEIGQRADVIISDTSSSRLDVIRQLRIPPTAESKVRAIHCGVSDHFRPLPGPDASAAKTVLYVGRSDPYKNLPLLVEAFASCRRACALPLRLVIAGSVDPRYPEATQRARDLGIADAVEWTGYLSDADLVRTYQAAAVLVLPSRYEGFGLPVLEAMGCGTPVICSDIGALKEIAGDAAVFVPPDDVCALSAQLARVLTDADLAASLRAKGPGQARRFPWEQTARETLLAYEGVCCL